MKSISALKSGAVLALGALLLAGCAGGDGSSPNPEGSAGSGGSTSESMWAVDGEAIAPQSLYDAAVAEGELTVYDAYPEGPWRALLDAFEEDTGISVEHVRLGSAALYERVLTESGVNQLAADAIGLTDTSLMQQLADEGVLAAYDSSNGLSVLEDGLYSPDHYWYYVSRNVLTIGYNTQLVAEEDVPKSWDDLLDPKFKGKIGFIAVTTGGSPLATFWALRELNPDYWTELAKQDVHFYDSASQLTPDIARGELAIGVTALGTIAEQADQGAPVRAVFPEEGVAAFNNTVAVTATAAHPNAARLYVEWLLSKRGQDALVSNTGEYPIRSDVDGPQNSLNPPSSAEIVMHIPPLEVWMDERDQLIADWTAVFGNR